MMAYKGVGFRFSTISSVAIFVLALFLLFKACAKLSFNTKFETLTPARNYEELNSLTFGNIKRTINVEKLEIIEYDLTRSVPDETNDIECVYLKNAKPAYHLCPHKGDDDWLSGQVRTFFVWEPAIQDLMKIYFEENPDAMFVDLGCNIGAHSLFAASLNQKMLVLSVEPYPKNVVRFHKAAHLNNVHHRITFVMAALSNKRGAVTFQEMDGSIAENSLVRKGNYVAKGFTTNAILINDLTPFAKKKKAFMKIDIEGSECHAFINAHVFFDTIDVQYILMELQHTAKEPLYCFESMLNFLNERHYKAFKFPYNYKNNDNPLNYTNWKNWNQHDVIFKKF